LPTSIKGYEKTEQQDKKKHATLLRFKSLKWTDDWKHKKEERKKGRLQKREKEKEERDKKRRDKEMGKEWKKIGKSDVESVSVSNPHKIDHTRRVFGITLEEAGAPKSSHSFPHSMSHGLFVNLPALRSWNSKRRPTRTPPFLFR